MTGIVVLQFCSTGSCFVLFSLPAYVILPLEGLFWVCHIGWMSGLRMHDCMTKHQIISMFVTSLVVVFVRQRCAWYPKKHTNSKETIARNTIRSIWVLWELNSHCNVPIISFRFGQKEGKLKQSLEFFLTCTTCGDKLEKESLIP